MDLSPQIEKFSRRLAEVEKTVQKLESDLVRFTEDISKASQAGDVDTVAKLSDDYVKADKQLRALFAEWETLSKALEETGAE